MQYHSLMSKDQCVRTLQHVHPIRWSLTLRRVIRLNGMPWTNLDLWGVIMLFKDIHDFKSRQY